MPLYKVEAKLVQVSYQTIIIEAPNFGAAKKKKERLQEIVDEKFSDRWEVSVPDFSDSQIVIGAAERLDENHFEDEEVIYMSGDGGEYLGPDITWEEINSVSL